LSFAESKNSTSVRRILPRHAFDARVKIEVTRRGEKVVTDGWARDLSESGMGAFVGTELFVDEVATVRIPLGRDLELAVPTRVVRSLGTEYGFQFLALSSTQREQIRRLLQPSKVIPYQPVG
jgi:hypothetical protein